MYEIKNKAFIEAYDNLCYRHDRLSVFSDFVKLCAISIYNSFAKNEEMEKEYIRTIRTYSPDEQRLFTKMYAELVMMYEECNEVTDILGPLYMKTSPKDKKLGQVFTPSYVSDFMAEVTVGNENSYKQEIKEKGFITFNDPACGSGRISSLLCKSIKKT